MWYVYVLRSEKDLRYYIGSTGNVAKRLKRHNAGGNPSTRYRRPFELVLQESYYSKSEALERERVLKSYKGGEAFKRLIEK